MPMPCVRLPEARAGVIHATRPATDSAGARRAGSAARRHHRQDGTRAAWARRRPFCEHGNVGGVQRGLFLDRQLHHAGTGCGGCGAHGWFADIGSVSGRRNRHRAQGRRLTGRAFMWRKRLAMSSRARPSCPALAGSLAGHEHAPRLCGQGFCHEACVEGMVGRARGLGQGSRPFGQQAHVQRPRRQVGRCEVARRGACGQRHQVVADLLQGLHGMGRRVGGQGRHIALGQRTRQL